MDHKVTFGGKPVTLVGNRCKVGETAPVFTVTDAGLQPVSSDVFHGKVRIYSVFPSVDTPVCSLQNIRFNREASKLGDDVVVVSLSVDLPFAQKRFCAAEGIDRVHVFSDYRELDFGMKYGFVIDSLRLLARGVVVVDRDDVVRYVEYVPEVTHEPDYEKALAFNTEAYDYDDEDSITLDNLAQTYYRLGNDKAKAREFFQKAIELKPTQIDTLYFLAQYDIEEGNKDAAREKLEKALKGRFSPLNYATREMVQASLDSL